MFRLKRLQSAVHEIYVINKDDDAFAGILILVLVTLGQRQTSETEHLAIRA
jgi:hypothetical protein